MAAGSFVVIKQGDIYRLLYSAKNFSTGLTDITAIPYNPSGIAQPATSAFTELGNSGVYYYDWDSTGKALGTWSFIIDSASKPAKAFTRVQVVDGDTLDDTIFEKIDTMLDSIISALINLDNKVTIIDGNVNDIETEVKNSTYGLNAIKAVVDAINSAVSGIQNNTQTTVALPEALLVPISGTNTYKIYVNTYNNSGTMEDPDDQDSSAEYAYVAVSVQNAAGTDRSGNLSGLSGSTYNGKKWMTRVEQGRFSCIYSVADSHPIEQLIFTFEYYENGQYRVIDRASRTVSSESDYTARFNTIDTTLATIDSNVNDIENIVTNATYGLSALKTLIDTIQAELANGTYGLNAIKNAVDINTSLLTNSTYGLNALKAILDTINFNTNGVSIDLHEIKGTGFNTATDSLKQISDRVYAGGIAL